MKHNALTTSTHNRYQNVISIQLNDQSIDRLNDRIYKNKMYNAHVLSVRVFMRVFYLIWNRFAIWVSVSLSGTFNALNFLRSKDKWLKVNIDWMPVCFVNAIIFALQLGHDLFCNRRLFLSFSLECVWVFFFLNWPSKLGHSSLLEREQNSVPMHRGSERKTQSKNGCNDKTREENVNDIFQSKRNAIYKCAHWDAVHSSLKSFDSFALSRTNKNVNLKNHNGHTVKECRIVRNVALL